MALNNKTVVMPLQCPDFRPHLIEALSIGAKTADRRPTCSSKLMMHATCRAIWQSRQHHGFLHFRRSREQFRD